MITENSTVPISPELKGISEAIKTQDNRITADPLFCVYEKRRIYGMDPDFTYDGYEWVNREGTDREGYKTLEDAIKDGCDEVKMEKVYYVEVSEFVNAHFTERGADQFIKINRHNLTNPYVYVTSLWRCEEMKAVRQLLMESGL